MDITKNRLRHYGEAITDTDVIDEGLAVIVPDTGPDALQIIGTKGSVYLQEKSCTQGTLRVTGSVNCLVSYISTEGKEPYTVNASIPFAFSKEIAGMEEEDRMSCAVRLLSVSAAMVNPRKLSLKTQLQVLEKLYKCQTLEYANDIISGNDENVNCLKEKVKLETICDVFEKRVVLSDEIRLNGEELDGGSVILKEQPAWVCEDVKVLPNKVMVRGRVDTTVAALGADGRFSGKNKFSAPFSQIIECEGVLPEDKIDVSFLPAREEIEIFTSSEDITTMTMAFAAVTECVVRREVEIEMIKDVYSTRWELDRKTCAITTPLTEPVAVTVPVRETVSLEAQAEKVVDIDVIGAGMAVKKGENAVGSNFYISLICQMADGTVSTCGKKTYVDGVCPKACEHDGWCAAQADKPVCEINGEGEIVVSFDAVFTVREGCGRPLEAVSQCQLDRSRAKESRTKASLIIKSAEKSERVWDIAKAYNTSPSVIAAANKLGQNDEIQAGRLILIPFVNR